MYGIEIFWWKLNFWFLKTPWILLEFYRQNPARTVLHFLSWYSTWYAETLQGYQSKGALSISGISFSFSSILTHSNQLPPFWRRFFKTLHHCCLVSLEIACKPPIDGFHQTSRRSSWCTEQCSKMPFGNLTLFLCKTCGAIFYCFVHQQGCLITWMQTKNTMTK